MCLYLVSCQPGSIQVGFGDIRCTIRNMGIDRLERRLLVPLKKRLHEQKLRAVLEIGKPVLEQD